MTNRSLALVALIAFSSQGCYLGRTPTAKRGAYVLNGTAAVMGGVILATAGADQNDCSQATDQVSCGAGNLGSGLASAFLGVTLLGAALVGTVVTLAVPTKVPQELPGRDRGTAPAQGAITAPGLRSAVISLD
jgi:hypothetical protein